VIRAQRHDAARAAAADGLRRHRGFVKLVLSLAGSAVDRRRAWRIVSGSICWQRLLGSYAENSQIIKSACSAGFIFIPPGAPA
jgi:hypothetical protein